MNASPSSPSEQKELPADLSLDLDEALDLQLGLAALGGLSHRAACDASERSQRRYDDRNHRMHETRMKAMGMEGEEKEPEADDMSQQVLIRSPVIHNHYASDPKTTPSPSPQQPPAQAQSEPSQPAGLSNLSKAAIVGLALLGTGGLGTGLYALLTRGGDTVINQPVLDANAYGVGLMPPGPPQTKAP